MREALSNVLRHAGASHVELRLACSADSLALEIRDDGQGFDADDAAAGASGKDAQGLANLRRRAELLGAGLRIRSAPGRGTALSLTMPVAAVRRAP